MKKYYYAGGVRIAMMDGSVVKYILTDHLGSTMVVEPSGQSSAPRQLYTAWGSVRFSSETLPTTFTFTG